MNGDSSRLREEDVDEVKAAGWSEEALYDAITVCALFNFYNKWIDGTGVSDMPADAYAAAGERLATLGYLPPYASRTTSPGTENTNAAGADTGPQGHGGESGTP